MTWYEMILRSPLPPLQCTGKLIEIFAMQVESLEIPEMLLNP
jgi:hypothetical protein